MDNLSVVVQLRLTPAEWSLLESVSRHLNTDRESCILRLIDAENQRITKEIDDALEIDDCF